MMDAALFQAVRDGDLETARSLIEAGANVDARAGNGDIPLHVAVAYGHTEIAKLLIANGSNLEARTLRGDETPLHLAARRGHMGVVEVLVAAGANINARDNMNATPAYGANHYKQRGIVDLLGRKGGIIEGPKGCLGSVIIFALLGGYVLLKLIMQ